MIIHYFLLSSLKEHGVFIASKIFEVGAILFYSFLFFDLGRLCLSYDVDLEDWRWKLVALSFIFLFSRTESFCLSWLTL